MAQPLFVRIAGAIGIVSLALLFVGLIPFVGADPTAGAGISAKAPGFSVNREFKGDRLPLAPNADTAALRDALKARQQPEKSGQIPVGCDASFSPITAPALASVYGRCAT